MMSCIFMNKDSEIESAIKVLEEGGIILYPTDTVYGLGVDATNVEAIKKLIELKGRPDGKRMLVMFSDLEMAGEYVELNDAARILADKFLPGPLTLVLMAKDNVVKALIPDKDTLGIRVPDNSFCLKLVKEFGKPIVTTSANKSGEKIPSNNPLEIAEYLGGIDLVIDQGELKESSPSTIVDISSGGVEIVRDGSISIEDIVKVFL